MKALLDSISIQFLEDLNVVFGVVFAAVTSLIAGFEIGRFFLGF